MVQSRKNDFLSHWQFANQARNPLLQHHPVLVPLALFAGSIALVIASFFADNLFPVLTLIGIPSALVCCLFAVVLGLCGVIVSITGLLELSDESHYRQIQLVLAPQPEERSYDCN